VSETTLKRGRGVGGSLAQTVSRFLVGIPTGATLLLETPRSPIQGGRWNSLAQTVSRFLAGIVTH